MAAKWADYLISAVRYNAAETHIERVKCHPDSGDSVGSATDESRQSVIKAIGSGKTFMTIFENPGTYKWELGAEVRVVTVEGTEYIRTDRDMTRLDNLGSLPRY